MRLRLSTRVQVCMHLALMVFLALFSAGLDDISPALALGAFVFGAFGVWLFSLPGARKYAFRSGGGGGYLARQLEENGSEHLGHKDRRAWDRSGRSSRLFCHALIGICGVLVCAVDGFSGEITIGAVIGGLAAASGVECGFALFKTGDSPLTAG